MGFGAGLEHHDAGVFRHPTKRKICRTSALMATGAFSFRPPSLPMARAEMREKSRRVYGNGSRSRNGHSNPMNDRYLRPKKKGWRAHIQHTRTHARTHAQLPEFGRLKSRIGSERIRRETRQIFSLWVNEQGHLSGSPHGESSLRWPCRATRPTPSIAIVWKNNPENKDPSVFEGPCFFARGLFFRKTNLSKSKRQPPKTSVVITTLTI